MDRCDLRFFVFISRQENSLIDSSVNDEVANRASNEKNSSKDISHMVQKNTADDQKQQRSTEIKVIFLKLENSEIQFQHFHEHFFRSK